MDQDLEPFATGGVASAGAYIAGEHGKELITSAKATRIYPADQTASMINYGRMGSLDMAPLVEEIKALRAEVKSLRGDTQQVGAIVKAGDAANVNATNGIVTAQQQTAWRQEVRAR